MMTKPREKSREKTRHLPPYHVILENDDFHSFDFVMEVLRKALGLTEQQALQFTQTAHRTGRAVGRTGNKEVAELKMEQIREVFQLRTPCHGAKLGAPGVLIEPAPA